MAVETDNSVAAPQNSQAKQTLKIKCECGSELFRIQGIQIVIICAECGEETPLNINAFTVRMPV